MFAAEPVGRLSAAALERQIHESLLSSGLSIIALPSPRSKPFRYAIYADGLSTPAIVRIYAWNATHGGGPRAADEFRIQLTGPMPAHVSSEITVIIGWSEPHGVFVGWDPDAHEDRNSASPSLQVRETTMDTAARQGIAAATRASGDVVVAFRPELLAAYCLSVREVHDGGNLSTVAWLTDLPSAVEEVRAPRSMIERRLEIAYRAWDFSRRIQKAYRHQCAICGLGLGMLEGAHIVPVAWPGSTDETKNGLALCRNHHAAYDRALINITPDYRIEVSRFRELVITNADNSVDSAWIRTLDGAALRVLPEDAEELPDPSYLEIGQHARRWMP